MYLTFLLLIQFIFSDGFGFSKQQIFDLFNSKLKFQKPLWTGPNLKRSDRRNVKLTTLLAIITLEASVEIFARIPQEFIYGSRPTPIVALSKEDKYDVIIFPGAGGPDQYTEALKRKIIESDRIKGVDRPVYVYDWLKWRGNFVRAAFDSQKVGAVVGEQLAANKNLQNVQVIGISVGAFAADSCINAYKSHTSTPRAVSHLTLLDPFCSKGVFGYGWGYKNFGLAADIAEDYLNSDDPVPTTSDPVTNAFTFDITQSKARQVFGGDYHSWPVAYLASNWVTVVDKEGNILEPSLEIEPKGGVRIIP